jgi:hypothetical protein
MSTRGEDTMIEDLLSPVMPDDFFLPQSVHVGRCLCDALLDIVRACCRGRVSV